MSGSKTQSSGPPLRAIAMVLIAFAIMFAGLGAFSLSGSEPASDSADTESSSEARSTTVPTSTAPASTAHAAAPPPMSAVGPSAPAAAEVDKSVAVRVLNNSVVSGLAGKKASALKADGWSNTTTGNYSSGTITKTTVYYSSGSASEKAAAEAIAETLGVTAEPRFAGIAKTAPGVIVIVTAD